MELVNTPTEQPYCIDILYLLLNGLYKITAESVKLILNVEQFGMRSNLA